MMKPLANILAFDFTFTRNTINNADWPKDADINKMSGLSN